MNDIEARYWIAFCKSPNGIWIPFDGGQVFVATVNDWNNLLRMRRERAEAEGKTNRAVLEAWQREHEATEDRLRQERAKLAEAEQRAIQDARDARAAAVAAEQERARAAAIERERVARERAAAAERERAEEAERRRQRAVAWEKERKEAARRAAERREKKKKIAAARRKFDRQLQRVWERQHAELERERYMQHLDQPSGDNPYDGRWWVGGSWNETILRHCCSGPAPSADDDDSLSPELANEVIELMHGTPRVLLLPEPADFPFRQRRKN